MKNKWFFEKNLPGTSYNQKLGFKIKRKIISGKTPYQKFEIFDVYELGKTLVLDGIIQLSEYDEFIYHEIIAHLPLFYHFNPQRVLIIGGGDGGTLREVLKHPIKEVYLVDIDKKIIEVSKKYLPFVSKGAFQDKRVKVFTEDGLSFVKKYKNYFDIVIIDVTDPNDLSLSIFKKRFYKDISNLLKKEGLMIIQTGCLDVQLSQVKKIFKNLKKIFPFLKIASVPILSFQAPFFSFILASKKNNLNKVNFRIINKRFKKLKPKTKYYSPKIHFAVTDLPEFLEKKII